jgi:hypothetical protein
MPILEIGLALSALKGLSELVEGGKTLLECASTIDKCLHLSEQAEKKLPKKKGAAQKNVEHSLEEFNQGNSESTNLGDIIGEMEDQKKLQAALSRVGWQLDIKYGEGCWAGILATRADRLKKAAENEKAQRVHLQNIKKRRNKVLIEIFKGIGILLFFSGAMYFLMQNF